MKKPVKLPFLDFSTRELRLRYCEAEVRLNRRLAPDVYRGVVPIVRRGAGLAIDAEGEAVEHAVWMRRLPDGRRLEELVPRGEAGPDLFRRLGRRLARGLGTGDVSRSLVHCNLGPRPAADKTTRRGRRESTLRTETWMSGRTPHRGASTEPAPRQPEPTRLPGSEETPQDCPIHKTRCAR